MAIVTNAFSTIIATGNREDLTDLLSIISPLEAPLYDAMGATQAKGMYHEWQCDELPAANADNAALEGDSYAAAAITPTKRYGNYTQISVNQKAVTEIQEVVSKAGRTSEVGYQKANALAAMKRDFEAILFNYGTAASGGAAGSITGKPRMRTVHSWVFGNTAATGYSGGNNFTATYISASAGITGTTITETVFNLILQDIWDDGGKPNACYVNGALKRLVSGWATSTSRVWEGKKAIVNVADKYEGDFCTLELKKDRHCASSLGYFLDESLWKKAIMLPVGEVEIGKTGMATPLMLRQAWTVEARNPSGNGAFVSAG